MFPTLSHNFTRAAPTFLSFLPSFVNLTISSLRPQYHFLVGSAAIKEVVFYQEASIGQGDPVSPQLFSFCAAIVIYPLRHLQVKVGMYRYVDDFLITFGQEATKHQVTQVFHELRRFWGSLCTARALRATFRLCSPRRAPKHIPWKCP